MSIILSGAFLFFFLVSAKKLQENGDFKAGECHRKDQEMAVLGVIPTWKCVAIAANAVELLG